MDFLEKILNQIKETENISSALPFNAQDIRRCLFLKIVESLNSFYYGHLFIRFSSLVNEGKLKITGAPSSEDRFHLTHLICLGREPWYSNYKSNLNRHLIVDSWTAFEIGLTTILNTKLDDTENNEMKLYQYYTVKSILKKNSSAIDAEVLRLLERKLRQSHVPITRKIDRIFKLTIGSYSRDAKSDKAFLTFFGHLRNSMHNNFIYTGNDYKYEFKGVRLVFQHNKFLWFSAHEDDIPPFLLDIVNELVLIFQAIVTAMDPGDTILDPIFDNSHSV